MSSVSNVNGNEALPKFAGRPIADSPAALAAASPARLTPAASTDSINSGFNVQSQVPAPAAKPVDANQVGSNPGDHRIPAKDGATGALAAIANAPGPRGETKAGS